MRRGEKQLGGAAKYLKKPLSLAPRMAEYSSAIEEDKNTQRMELSCLLLVIGLP